MIWLASFPRSGNTYVRNILRDVYGIESSYDDEQGYENYEVVKTHFLPEDVDRQFAAQPVIYLLRDGRDAYVSLAHHTKDIAQTNDNFEYNLAESIVAAEHSYFGGWSLHALKWIQKADIVIRYEDLINDPLAEVERLNKIMHLPAGTPENLPTFQQLRNKANPYGVLREKVSEGESIGEKFFRKGKAGAWKEEMPEKIFDLFWSIHGDTMEKLGYQKDGSMLDREAFQKRIAQIKSPVKDQAAPIKVLMEAHKLIDKERDGINRYVYSLCRAMDKLQKDKGAYTHIAVDLLVEGEILPLHQDIKVTAKEREEDEVPPPPWVEQSKSVLRKWLPLWIYKPLRKLYVMSPARLLLRKREQYRKWRSDMKNLSASRTLFAQYDLIHITLPQHFLFFKRIKHRFIVTVHDMTHKLFPDYHLLGNISNARQGMTFIKKHKAGVIAVSEATKRDLCRMENIPAGRVRLIYEAADRERFNILYDENVVNATLRKYGLEGQQFFFSLATLEPRKNLKKTVQAFLKLKNEFPEKDIKFVLAGKPGWKEKPDYLKREDVLAIGYVRDEDLSALFTACFGFCYVSHYEGFGLPLLEAMRCGAPVIYGNNSSMVEIVRDAGLPAEAKDVEDITRQMRRLLMDKTLRQSLKNKGYRRALQFSWERTARETFDYYEQIVKEHKRL